MSGRVWRTQKPFWMNNVEGSRSLRAIARASVKKAGVKTAFAVPIKKGKKMLAVLAFCARDVRPKDSRLIETISAVAAQLSIALERKLGEQELKKSEARLELAQEVAGIGSWEIDHGTGRRYWSKQTYRICGVAIDESPVTVTNRRDLVLPEDWHKWDAWHDAVISAHQPPSVEYRIVRPDGEIRVVSVEGKLIHDEARGSFRTVGTLQDITEARLVSRQLAQAQKMEALGTLTSGLAHDFNNILSVIMPNLEFLRDHAQDHPMAVESMADALDAAKRGAELIRGLLGIARHSALEHEPVDVNRLVGETVKLLSRLLGKNIDILVNLSDDIGIVSTDPTQLKMAIANLATNARDAMPNGGRLTITTRTRHITANDVPEDPDVRAGDYCVIQVSDSGTGMSAETLKGIFDPFFTTKPEGKGTGLGLSMVFRLMKLSKGTIRAISRPGEGTTFDLLFPRVSEAPLSAIDKSSIDRISGGSEHVLIVDDDPKVLALAARILRNLGYTVWEAGAFGPALNLLNNGSPVDLLLSDAVNSGAGENLGLVREALRLRPGLKVLRTSGNPREEEAPGERLPFLAKPYTTAALAQAVRAALDAA
jgi:PAS domain S-box-containing protein